ncbi:hypothetical protein LY622_05855 [Halomonas sp. M5N1S17]|uniref:hypothetical protein n=1 Tax=Halomonas alkalisoli TaxID=2907158 RepID=UPI001F282D00|nr:hypothetical protein [Halomonas alkalisoli]MCE9662960.1 hypothetical protein [Halomonas alkalisoli]
MKFKKIHSWFLFQLKCFFWRLVKIILICTFSYKRIWKRRVKDLDFEQGWQEGIRIIESDLSFFQVMRYRPAYHGDFHEEIKSIFSALAFLDYQYYSSDLVGYKKSINTLGCYFEYVKKTKYEDVVNSEVWPLYLHQKATLNSMLGNPTEGASMNCEVKHIFEEKGNNDFKAISYGICAMCCRVETFSVYEKNLVKTIESDAKELTQQLQSYLCKDNNKFKRKDVVAEFILSQLLRCKIQFYMEEPNVEIIEDSLEEIKPLLSEIKGVDKTTYDIVVPFYKALLKWLKKEEPHKVRPEYDKALEERRKSKTGGTHFCLLKLPDRLLSGLAEYVVREKIYKDISLHRMQRSVSSRFVLYSILIPLASIAFALMVANYEVPANFWVVGALLNDDNKFIFLILFSLSVAIALINLLKLRYELEFPGLVSPGALRISLSVIAILLAIVTILFRFIEYPSTLDRTVEAGGPAPVPSLPYLPK